MYTIYVVFKCVPGKREEYIQKLNELKKARFVSCF